MNGILAIPIEVRYALLAVLGAILGGQINHAIYRFSWQPRPIGPWMPPHSDAPDRQAIDRVPLLGWFFLRRESPLHGMAYWLRPLLIEIVVAAGLPVLYWAETTGWLLPLIPASQHPGQAILHAQFLAHTLLISLMLVATFIDFDDQTIPDEITIPGVLLGLVLVALLPGALLPITLSNSGRIELAHLVVTSSTHSVDWVAGLGGPLSWPTWLDQRAGLLVGLACFVGWFLAILPKTCTLRRGLWRGLLYVVVSSWRGWDWRIHAPILLFGLGTIGTAFAVGGAHWQAELSALIGLAFGGGLIWSMRIIGTYALHKEAMGFGDVTLMAMIGVFVGWQSSLLIFFMAPAVAVFIALAQWIVTRRKDLAFGPYLCAATLILLFTWKDLWPGYAQQLFGMGLLIPALVASCLVLIGGVLSCWRLLGEFLYGSEESAGESKLPVDS